RSGRSTSCTGFPDKSIPLLPGCCRRSDRIRCTLLRIKLRCFILCLLCVFLVLASLDSVPDPPALRHDNTTFKSFSPGETVCSFGVQLLPSNPLRGCSHLGFRFLAFSTAHEPRLSGDSIFLTQYASDTSPPVV